MERLIEQAKKYRLDTVYLGRAHYKTGDEYRSKHNKIGIPTIILSTVVGTTIFASLTSNQNNILLTVLTGLLSITAAVLAALQTFFNFSELSTKHRDIASRYSELRRKFDLYILKCGNSNAADTNTSYEELAVLTEELSALANSGLPIPSSAWDTALKELKKLQDDDIPTSVRFISEEGKVKK